MLDSKYAARLADAARHRRRCRRPARACRFSATAYCKGLDDRLRRRRSQTGIAAADPALLPVGSVVEIDVAETKYNGIYTVLDTGPAVQGREIDIYMWSCHEALRVRPPADSPDRAAPRLEPAARRRRASSIGCSSVRTPTPPQSRRPLPLASERHAAVAEP